jgi:signal transduction histidine kinase
MACSGQALTGDGGGIAGAVVALHDITDQNKAEEEEPPEVESTFVNVQ